MLIFSDVDGTLLGEGGVCDLPADALRDAFERYTVVLASSRDCDELREVQEMIGLRGALVAEDGAVIVDAGGPEVLGTPRQALLAALHQALPEAEHRALLAAEPEAARQRLGSILIPVQLATPALGERLVEVGLASTPGGHWATITAGSSKGSAASVLAARMGVPRWVAIGNAQNDATLLDGASRAFVIRNADGHDPFLAKIPAAVKLTAAGPDGWLEMLALLDRPHIELP